VRARSVTGREAPIAVRGLETRVVMSAAANAGAGAGWTSSGRSLTSRARGGANVASKPVRNTVASSAAGAGGTNAARIVARGGGMRWERRGLGGPETATRAISGDATGKARGDSKLQYVTMTPLDEIMNGMAPLEPMGDGKFTNESEYLHTYRLLVKCGRPHDAVDLLRHLKTAGVPNLAARVSHRDFFETCDRLRVVSPGLEFLQVIESQDIRPYNMLVRTCALVGDLGAANLAVKQMKKAGFQPDLKLYTTFISACSKSGDVERAFEVFTELKRAGFEPNEQTYASMIDALKRDISAKVAGAKKRSVDAESIRSTLQSCFAVYAEMKQNTDKVDRTVINSLLNACARASTVAAITHEACEKARELYAEMVNAGISADSFSYQSLIYCAMSEKNYSYALELYEEMRTAGVKSTLQVETVIIRLYGKLDKPNDAKRLWYSMIEDKIVPDQMAYATIMHIALRQEDEDFCDELMSSMRLHRVRPGPQLYATLAGVAARQGNASKVEEIIRNAEIRRVRVPIECYNSLIAAHARADRPDLAVEAAQKIRDAGFELDAVSYEGLVFAYAFSRDLDEAKKLFDELMVKEIRPTFPTLNCMLACFARNGDVRHSLEILEMMEQYGYEPDEITWRELLLGYARTGDIEGAWKVYKDSRASGKHNSEVALNVILGQTLVHIRSLTDLSKRSSRRPTELGSFDDDGGYVAQEWAERAVAAFHEATLAGIIPRIETFSTMLACIRPPSTDEQNAADYSEVARAVSHEMSSHEDAGKYYPTQALIMFEEAQGLGVVPAFSREDEDFVYDVREFPPAAAEVMLLTWLRVVRRRTDAHGIDTPIPTMTIRVRADEEVVRMIKEQHMERSDHALGRLCQTGDRLLVLLRRLRINYGGGLQEGKIELSGHALGRWLQGFVPVQSAGSVFGETSLSGGVISQAMRIRSNSLNGTDDDVWTPSKMRQPAFNIYDYYGDEKEQEFGAKPFYPKNWVQNANNYVSSYDEDDDVTDLERILEGRK